MAFPVTGHSQTLTLFHGSKAGTVFLRCQHFFGQYLHKSSSSTICLLSRSLLQRLAAKTEAFFLFFFWTEVDISWEHSLMFQWTSVWCLKQSITLYTKSAKNNQPYHFTNFNTQQVKYYQVKTQVLNMTDSRNPMCVQFHNLWGRLMAGISLFGKGSPLLQFLLDCRFCISHSLGVSLARIPAHTSITYLLFTFPTSHLLLSLCFFLFCPRCQYVRIHCCYVLWFFSMAQSKCVFQFELTFFHSLTN